MLGETGVQALLMFYGGISFLAMFYWFIVFIYSKRSNYFILGAVTVIGTIYYLNEFHVIFHLKKADNYLLALLTLTSCILASDLNSFRKFFSAAFFQIFWIITGVFVAFQTLSSLLFSWQTAVIASHMLAISLVILVMIMFAYLWIARQLRTARFAFFVYMPEMVGYFIFALCQMNILPSGFSITGPVGATIFTMLLFYGMVTYVIAIRNKREKEHVEKEELIRRQYLLLEQKVEERTCELEMEKVRSEEFLIQASQKQIAELELQSLRARLNPHFMFNCLTAIQQMILRKDLDKSYNYLAKFAKLLRMLLENSEKPFVSLQKELDFLELYLSLEKLRLTDLQISVTSDACINKNDVFIPNIILQPYLENALWHGLSHKPCDRKLELNIRKGLGAVTYEVKDNGIGRKRSAKLKTILGGKHQSKGMELLAKRFRLLSEEYGSEIKTEVTDLMKDEDSPGTKVSITIPDSLTIRDKIWTT